MGQKKKLTYVNSIEAEERGKPLASIDEWIESPEQKENQPTLLRTGESHIDLPLKGSQFERTAMLLGEDAIEILQNSSVIIFGLGGVGGQIVETLARAGIGRFLLIDHDTVSKSNINRQIFALYSTVGRLKTEVAKERILDINPYAEVKTLPVFITADTIKDIDFTDYDIIADAVDTVAAKIEIIKMAKSANKEVITCMGAGGRFDAEFKATDIHKTFGCPLARVVRTRLKQLAITDVTAIFAPIGNVQKSDFASLFQHLPEGKGGIDLNEGTNAAENVKMHTHSYENDSFACQNSAEADYPSNTFDFKSNTKLGKRPIGSLPFIPPAAGLLVAKEVIKKLFSIKNG